MTDVCLTVFCLVDAESISHAFSIDIDRGKTVDHLKNAIKTKKSPRFDEIAADELALWRVSVPDGKKDDFSVLLDCVFEKSKLKPTTELSRDFDIEFPRDMVHIIVQRPTPGNATL